MNIARHIPNTITLCNLLCGLLAVGAAYRQLYEVAALLVVAGAVFDFFDGFAARLLGVASPIGKELDSLADVITFGAVPAVLAAMLIAEANIIPSGNFWELLPAACGLLIAAFSALRLAKFNLDERQSQSFIGLPTPANALFWVGLAASVDHWTTPFVGRSTLLVGLLLVLVAASCWILVAEVPMFALKFKHFRWEGDNRLRFSFIVAALLLGLGAYFLGFGTLGLSAIVVLYVVLSLLTQRQPTAPAEMAE